MFARLKMFYRLTIISNSERKKCEESTNEILELFYSQSKELQADMIYAALNMSTIKTVMFRSNLTDEVLERYNKYLLIKQKIRLTWWLKNFAAAVVISLLMTGAVLYKLHLDCKYDVIDNKDEVPFYIYLFTKPPTKTP